MIRALFFCLFAFIEPVLVHFYEILVTTGDWISRETEFVRSTTVLELTQDRSSDGYPDDTMTPMAALRCSAVVPFR